MDSSSATRGKELLKVDDLVRALGLDGIDKCEASRIAR